MKPKKLLILLLAITPLLPGAAWALLVNGDEGPERVVIQLKESYRQSEQLDSGLATLASFEADSGLVVQERWVGGKYLELVSFPKDFSEAKCLSIIDTIQQMDAVEKVVPVSALNLEFRPGDFDRPYDPSATIPDAARRGLDAERVARGPAPSLATVLAPSHLTNHIIVRWKDEYVWHGESTGFFDQVFDFNKNAGCAVITEFRFTASQLIQVLEFNEKSSSVAQMLALYRASEMVDFAQPDYLYSAHVVPNDEGYPLQWGLPKISAPTAWNATQGTQNLVVAVGDTGANVSHPDLAPNLAPGWYNFIGNNTNVTDEVGHGMNVAGIIGAKGNNGIYLCGVDWNVSQLILKVIDNQHGDSGTIARGIQYAWEHGALAINLSLGSVVPSSNLDGLMFAAIKAARMNNMVVVASAGNNNVNSDTDSLLVSPACIPVDNVISVGATTQSDGRASFSNYGQYRVELGAPGVGIYGLHPNPGFYTVYDGTSQAAPHVTGALELVKSVYGFESYAGLKDRVLMGVESISGLNGVFRTGGRLNLDNALKKRNMIRNLSTRARVEANDRRMIGGFVIGGGTASLKVAIRGMGPSLPNLGVPKLTDPQIRIYSGANQIFFNDDWGNLPQDQKNDLSSSGLTPTDSHEAAAVQLLAPGAYTVIVESQNGQFGVGLFEIYELGVPGVPNNQQTRLLNVSTRCIVGTGNEVAIAGTILGDPSIIPNRRILSLGRGPSLSAAGVNGVLPNPYLEFYNSTGGIVASNDQWKDIDGSSTGLEAKLVEAGFRPGPTAPDQYVNESNVWPTLRPGAFTAVLRDAGNASGIGIVELYEY